MDDPLRAVMLELLDRLLNIGDVNRMKFCDRGAVGHVLKVGFCRTAVGCMGGQRGPLACDAILSSLFAVCSVARDHHASSSRWTFHSRTSRCSARSCAS